MWVVRGRHVIVSILHPFEPLLSTAKAACYRCVGGRAIRRVLSCASNADVSRLTQATKTLNSGYLGSRNDEERSEMRYVV